ncbi:MAG: hypothetical protein V7727_00430 [Sneathiella sp.]
MATFYPLDCPPLGSLDGLMVATPLRLKSLMIFRQFMPMPLSW